MPKMIANTTFNYDRRRLQKGATFEASVRDARVLSLVGRASYQETEDHVETATAAIPEPPPRRRYKRRDMQAEG